MEISIHRREVTINNLEQELEEKYAEIRGLKERIKELEKALLENQNEMMRKKIFMEIMDQNLRLKKAGRSGKNPKRSKESGSSK